jgi:3-hydroxybutyryl-CoA dehydrogenase
MLQCFLETRFPLENLLSKIHIGGAAGMDPKPFETVCIVGAGYMGAQIGLHCAMHGYTAWFVDSAEESLQRAILLNARQLDQWLVEGQITRDQRQAAMSRMHTSTSLQAGASRAGLVIESVPEQLALKRTIFSLLDEACPRHTILATNSSSIRISAIEGATGRPDKVLNMHFYAALWRRKVVELMRGTATSDETIESAQKFARSLKLVPLLVSQESTGFIFNRVWRAIKKECLHLVDEGVASYEDVDRAWMILNSHPAGPFGLMDQVGLDVVRDIELVYYHESGDEADAPPRLLLDKIARGELGVKTGKGFYTYPNPSYQDPSWLEGEK